MAEIEQSKPEFVTRDGIIADGKYVEWLGELKYLCSGSDFLPYAPQVLCCGGTQIG